MTIQLSTTGDPAGEIGADKCICKAKITDYALQVNTYGGDDVKAGDPLKLIKAHELYHVQKKAERWKSHKDELEKLLDKYEYKCDQDCKVPITQDLSEIRR